MANKSGITDSIAPCLARSFPRQVGGFALKRLSGA
jgi:hypothetical protein